MGLLKKVGKSISKGVKSVGKMASNVLKSNVLKAATSALGFVPGFNAVGVIGKGLSMLGKGSSIKKFLGKGLQMFGKLAKGLNLGNAVKQLASGQFQPIGGLVKLLGGGLKPFRAADFLKMLQPNVGAFKNMYSTARQFQKMTGKLPVPGHLLPPGWAELSKGLNADAHLRRLESLAPRMQSVGGMFQELLRHLETQSLSETGKFIRV